MTRLVVCLFLVGLLVVSGAAPGQPVRPNVVPGLELDAPQKRVRAGYLKVTARTEGKEVSWDVESQWDNDDVEFTWEQLDSKTVLVGIPHARGVIRITACALVEGKLTRIAKTAIEVEPEDKRPPQPPTPPVATTAPKGKASFAYFVIDQEGGDVNLNTLVATMGFRNAVGALGVTVRVVGHKSEASRARGLDRIAADVGIPALVLTDDKENVIGAPVRCPPSREAILEQVKRYR